MRGDGARRILLGHLGSFGDCLYATTVARQIKHDDPNCHLTWALGRPYASIAHNNPHVDEIWEYPVSARGDLLALWKAFEQDALARVSIGDFDEAIFTQIFPANVRYFDGTLRSSMFRASKRPINVPVEPVVELTDAEVENVHAFARQHQLESASKVILFECSPLSGQSRLDARKALSMSRSLIGRFPDLKIVLSSDARTDSGHPNIIDGHELTFRENAELSKFCSLMVGVSSGISWLCTSGWAKRLPTIQVLSPDKSVYASMKHDHDYFGLATDHLIEMSDEDMDQVEACITKVFDTDFGTARSRYHRDIEPDFRFYFDAIRFHCLSTRSISPAWQSMGYTLERYGLRTAFVGSFIYVLLHTAFVLPFTRLSRRLGIGSSS